MQMSGGMFCRSHIYWFEFLLSVLLVCVSLYPDLSFLCPFGRLGYGVSEGSFMTLHGPMVASCQCGVCSNSFANKMRMGFHLRCGLFRKFVLQESIESVGAD